MIDVANSGNNGGGLLAPVWRLLDNGLAAAQNRLEIFRVEAQEEKVRLIEIILLASALMVLGTLALAVATVAIVIYTWDRGPEIILSWLIGAYTLGAYLSWRGLRARLKSEAPFASSAEEMEKDRQCIPRSN